MGLLGPSFVCLADNLREYCAILPAVNSGLRIGPPSAFFFSVFWTISHVGITVLIMVLTQTITASVALFLSIFF